jgi:hypothetical protein
MTDMDNMQKLTVYHYSEIKEEERRITLSPVNITVIAAETEDVVVNGRNLRKTAVLFVDGNSIDLLLNHSDLEMLEGAIGSFCFG